MIACESLISGFSDFSDCADSMLSLVEDTVIDLRLGFFFFVGGSGGRGTFGGGPGTNGKLRGETTLVISEEALIGGGLKTNGKLRGETTLVIFVGGVEKTSSFSLIVALNRILLDVVGGSSRNETLFLL